MASKFRLIPMDFVAVVLTLLGSVLHFVGFFAAPWWIHNGNLGHSYFGMMSFRMCEVGCRTKSVLDINGGTEWIFAVRIFEVFAIICSILAMICGALVIFLRRKAAHTTLIYVLGAGALFNLLGVFIFLGCKSRLEEKVGENSSLMYSFALCLVGALVCIAAAVVAGVTLRKHLLDLDYYDDDDDEEECS